MKWLLAPLVALVAAGAVALWARSIPVPADRYHERGMARVPGDYSARDRFEAVRLVSDPPAALARLSAVAERAPRTTRLAGSVADGHVSFVTRTRVMGFPDVSNLWIDGDRLHASGTLVVGSADMGVNERRIRGWIEAAGPL